MGGFVGVGAGYLLPVQTGPDCTHAQEVCQTLGRPLQRRKGQAQHSVLHFREPCRPPTALTFSAGNT